MAVNGLDTRLKFIDLSQNNIVSQLDRSKSLRSYEAGLFHCKSVTWFSCLQRLRSRVLSAYFPMEKQYYWCKRY